MASPFFMRWMVLAETPCLKISSYSVMFLRSKVSKKGLYDIMLFYILAVRNVKITLLHGNLDLVAFDSHYAALVISVSGYPWTADDFIAIFF